MWGTLLGGGIRRGALRPLKIPMRIFSISTPNRDANVAYIFKRGSWLSCMNSRSTGPLPIERNSCLNHIPHSLSVVPSRGGRSFFNDLLPPSFQLNHPYLFSNRTDSFSTTISINWFFSLLIIIPFCSAVLSQVCNGFILWYILLFLKLLGIIFWCESKPWHSSLFFTITD